MRFWYWLLISLFLHAAAVSPLVLSEFQLTEVRNDARLQIELFGMVTDRQTVEKKAQGTPQPSAPTVVSPGSIVPPGAPQAKKADRPQPKPEPQPEPQSQPDIPLFEQSVPESMLLEAMVEIPLTEIPLSSFMEQSEARPGGVPSIPIFQVGSAGSAGRGGTDDINQAAQSIRNGMSEQDIISAYTAKIARRLQTNLTYPAEVKRKGIDGIAVVAFTITESGNIKDGSLRVQRSSGYAALDSSAEKSARMSAPFEKPPKELTVAIEVSFRAELKRAG